MSCKGQPSRTQRFRGRYAVHNNADDGWPCASAEISYGVDVSDLTRKLSPR
jgi:hypothetical protein